MSFNSFSIITIVLNHITHHNYTQNQSSNLSIPTKNGFKTTTSSNFNTTTQTSNEKIDHHHLTSSPMSTQLLHNNNSLLGRGMLVTDYVKNYGERFDNLTYNNDLLADCSKYSAFNFVSIEIG